MKYSPEIVVKWFAEHGLTAVPEYRFDPHRKWRFDFVLMRGDVLSERVVALEVEGGAWTGGRHTRGSGFVKDIEKYNAATLQGWKVLRCVPDDLCTTDTVEMVKRALNV